MPTGKDPEIKGTAGGYPGVAKEKHQGSIEDHVFSKSWATPLGADNPRQPGPGPRDAGGVQEPDSGMSVPNPLDIPNVDFTHGPKGSPKKSHGSKGNG
jgi:hypothetical protein